MCKIAIDEIKFEREIIMKLLKKSVATLLAIIMVFSMFTSPATAVTQSADFDMTDIEEVQTTVTNIFDTVIVIIKNVHNLVGGIMGVFGKKCPFCDKMHDYQDMDIFKKYVVSFDLNYDGAPTVKNQKVSSGKCATAPDVEQREGFQLIGWYSSSGIFDFSMPVEEDLELTARWYDENDTKDSDKDGLPDSLEIQFGTDPYGDDSDNDGVSDYNELNWLNSDPLNANNALEDPDKDGLNNAEETRFGTNPVYADSDYDHLSDYDEIYVYHTNPLVADTDGDGVIDGVEVQNGSDPCAYERTFTTQASCGVINNDTPVSATATVVTGSEGAGTLEISEVTQSDNHLISSFIPGFLGSAYDFSIDGKLISATLTFEYDTSLGSIGKNFQPRIYYVNPKTGEFEELPDQIVENGKVIANTSHFSTYILLNKVEFESVWSNEIVPPSLSGDDNSNSSLDMVFVIDYSGSMSWNDSSYLRKTVTNEFIKKLREDIDKAAIVSFIKRPTVLSQLTNDKDSLTEAVNSIVNNDGYGTYAGTNGSSAIKTAIDLFEHSTASNKYIVFLTDGKDTEVSYSYSDLTADAKNKGIVIYSIGLGTADVDLLTEIATNTSGKYYHASVANDLYDIYDGIKKETIDYTTDSNSDGISDYYTELINAGKLLPSDGTNEFVGVTDIYGTDCADWDGDGLLNGEEISIATSKTGEPYIKMQSNPLFIDSDGDGIDDYKEVKVYNTNPLKHSYDAYDVENLTRDDNFVYVEHVVDESVANTIAGFFDWQKTNETKETYIDYFYDYASESNLDATAEKRKELKKREEALETIEFITSIIKIGKDSLDLTTDLGSYDSAVKGQITKYNNKHKNVLINFNKKDYDKVIESADVDDFSDALGFIEDVCDGISKPELLDKASEVLSAVTAVAEKIPRLKKVRLNLGKGFNTFSRKYQVWLGKRPTGDVTIGTSISVILDGVDIVTSVAEISNLYGKLQANSEAFSEYIDLLEHISENAEKNYTRVAAGDIIKIVLDKSNSEYYKQLSKVCLTTNAKNFINISLSIVGDICPYVKVAHMVIKVVEVSLELTGITECAKAYVKAQAIYAISKGCNKFLKDLLTKENDSYTFDAEDIETVKLYLTQLAQSRIVGEDNICTYLTTFTLSNWISKIIARTSNEEMDGNFNIIISGLYRTVDDLGLQVSKKLPRYNKSSSISGGGNGGGGGGSRSGGGEGSSW